MKMKSIFTILLVSLLLAGCGKPQSKTPLWDQVASLVRVIANPEEFDGKTIHVTGFLNLEFEGDALYLDRDHRTYGLTKNAVWINVPEDVYTGVQKYDESYVLVTGRFKAGHGGHMGLFSGEITIDKAEDIDFTVQQETELEKAKGDTNKAVEATRQ